MTSGDTIRWEQTECRPSDPVAWQDATASRGGSAANAPPALGGGFPSGGAAQSLAASASTARQQAPFTEQARPGLLALRL